MKMHYKTALLVCVAFTICFIVTVMLGCNYKGKPTVWGEDGVLLRSNEERTSEELLG